MAREKDYDNMFDLYDERFMYEITAEYLFTGPQIEVLRVILDLGIHDRVWIGGILNRSPDTVRIQLYGNDKLGTSKKTKSDLGIWGIVSREVGIPVTDQANLIRIMEMGNLIRKVPR